MTGGLLKICRGGWKNKMYGGSVHEIFQSSPLRISNGIALSKIKHINFGLPVLETWVLWPYGHHANIHFLHFKSPPHWLVRISNPIQNGLDHIHSPKHVSPHFVKCIFRKVEQNLFCEVWKWYNGIPKRVIDTLIFFKTHFWSEENFFCPLYDAFYPE